MILGYFMMLPDDYLNTADSVIATNCFVNNYYSAITTKNYWDVLNDYKPLMHTWYVGVLMQFYLVYPLLFLVSKLNKINPKRTLLTIISTLAVFSLFIYLMTEDTTQRFFYLPSRFFEFAVGGIVALIYNPNENKPFGKWYVYFCYILLLIFMFVNIDIFPAIIRLVAVVVLSCVLLCSQNVLENQVTGNVVLAKLGAASYSIFVWHQILLAYYRYSIRNDFTLISYSILLVGTVLLSWISYKFIEQTTTKALKIKRNKAFLYAITAVVFIVLNSFLGYIYLKAGVVRDVPELNYNKNDIHRRLHAEYVDRVYQYDKDFDNDNKRHWYVIGNSFGRDFVNVVLESRVSDEVEIVYSTEENYRKERSRFENADRVFISTYGLSEDLINDVELFCLAYGLKRDQLIIVGEKNYGANNGQIYAKRNKVGYYDKCVDVVDEDRYIFQNHHFAEVYGDRYIDLMSIVLDHNKVRVFTPDHHFISTDCRHLSKAGAIFYAQSIKWEKYL